MIWLDERFVLRNNLSSGGRKRSKTLKTLNFQLIRKTTTRCELPRYIPQTPRSQVLEPSWARIDPRFLGLHTNKKSGACWCSCGLFIHAPNFPMCEIPSCDPDPCWQHGCENKDKVAIKLKETRSRPAPFSARHNGSLSARHLCRMAVAHLCCGFDSVSSAPCTLPENWA